MQVHTFYNSIVFMAEDCSAGPLNRQNQSPKKDTTSIPATFLRVTVTA